MLIDKWMRTGAPYIYLPSKVKLHKSWVLLLNSFGEASLQGSGKEYDGLLTFLQWEFVVFGCGIGKVALAFGTSVICCIANSWQWCRIVSMRLLFTYECQSMKIWYVLSFNSEFGTHFFSDELLQKYITRFLLYYSILSNRNGIVHQI